MAQEKKDPKAPKEDAGAATETEEVDRPRKNQNQNQNLLTDDQRRFLWAWINLENQIKRERDEAERAFFRKWLHCEPETAFCLVLLWMGAVLVWGILQALGVL